MWERHSTHDAGEFAAVPAIEHRRAAARGRPAARGRGAAGGRRGGECGGLKRGEESGLLGPRAANNLEGLRRKGGEQG